MKIFKVLSRIFYLGGPHHGPKGCDNEDSRQPRFETLSLHNGKGRKGARAYVWVWLQEHDCCASCFLLVFLLTRRLTRYLRVVHKTCSWFNLTFLCLTLPYPRTEPKHIRDNCLIPDRFVMIIV